MYPSDTSILLSAIGLLVCLAHFTTGVTPISAALTSVAPAIINPVYARSCEQELAKLGRQVEAVRRAISDPDSPGAMAAIRMLGTDSRYYTMVRGWLAMQLQGDQSIVAAAGRGQRPKIESRIRFLQQAIGFIDLE